MRTKMVANGPNCSQKAGMMLKPSISYGISNSNTKYYLKAVKATIDNDPKKLFIDLSNADTYEVASMELDIGIHVSENYLQFCGNYKELNLVLKKFDSEIASKMKICDHRDDDSSSETTMSEEKHESSIAERLVGPLQGVSLTAGNDQDGCRILPEGSRDLAPLGGIEAPSTSDISASPSVTPSISSTPLMLSFEFATESYIRNLTTDDYNTLVDQKIVLLKTLFVVRAKEDHEKACNDTSKTHHQDLHDESHDQIEHDEEYEESHDKERLDNSHEAIVDEKYMLCRSRLLTWFHEGGYKELADQDLIKIFPLKCRTYPHITYRKFYAKLQKIAKVLHANKGDVIKGLITGGASRYRE